MKLKSNILFAIIYLFMDVLWITTMSSIFYNKKIEAVQRYESFQFKVIPAVLAYITLLIVLFFICIPLSKYYEKKYSPWFVFGVIGFCVYGVYNFTNSAIFNYYDLQFLTVDLLWGTFSFALLGFIYKRLLSTR